MSENLLCGYDMIINFDKSSAIMKVSINKKVTFKKVSCDTFLETKIILLSNFIKTYGILFHYYNITTYLHCMC